MISDEGEPGKISEVLGPKQNLRSTRGTGCRGGEACEGCAGCVGCSAVSGMLTLGMLAGAATSPLRLGSARNGKLTAGLRLPAFANHA